MRDGLGDAGAGLFPGPAAAAKPHQADHRSRLRRRFVECGADALADYELLELVLFRAIPRRDVKPLAKRLIARFGGLDGALAATPARLAEVQGVGEAVIGELKLVEAAATRLARARVINRPAIQGWAQLVAYCRTALARRETEQVRCLFLDRKNVLIADEALGEGTVDHVPVYPREVLRRALHHNASALILVHNHPSGDPTPSRADIAMTREIAAALKPLGIVLHDHVIVGASGETSFRAADLI